LGPLFEHRPLEFRNRPIICIIMPPAGVGVSMASVKLRNPDLALRQPLHDRRDIAERTRETVELPDHEDITLAEMIEVAR